MEYRRFLSQGARPPGGCDDESPMSGLDDWHPIEDDGRSREGAERTGMINAVGTAS